MQTLIYTLCIYLLPVLFWSTAAQPAPGAIPNAEEGQEQAIRSIPLPPPPGKTVHATYCPIKTGKAPLRDTPLKVNYSRKPEAGRGDSGKQITWEGDVPEIIECHDTKTYSALLAGGYVPPPPPRITCSDIFRVVEEMPRFPGCEGLSSTEEKRQCSEEKLLEFIYQNLDYLVLARENCIEGTVVIQFVIEKDGSVTNARIVRDIGGQFGEAALSVVRKMKKQGLKWIPGKQRGRPVRVQFTMPIRFRLDCTERPSEVQYEEPAPVPEQEVNKEPMEKAGEALHPMEIVRSGTPLQTQPEGFRLFPNPAVDKINVHFQAQPGPVALAIVNVSGQVLWKQEYNHPGGTLEEQASLAPWPSGTYFLRIEQPGTVQTRTFIKQR